MKPPRLILTPEQAAEIQSAGMRFAVAFVHPGSYPTTPGKMLIDLIEVDQPTADAALRVARGEARAVRIKQTPPAPTS
jgi:hypothetical protein